MTGRRMGLALQLLGIGWYVGLSIGGGGLGGYWLGQQFGLNPLFTLLGIGVGIAAAVYGMYRMLMAVLASASEQAER
jgi:hypothetical protein